MQGFGKDENPTGAVVLVLQQNTRSDVDHVVDVDQAGASTTVLVATAPEYEGDCCSKF